MCLPSSCGCLQTSTRLPRYAHGVSVPNNATTHQTRKYTNNDVVVDYGARASRRALDCVKPCYNCYVAVDKFTHYFLLSSGSNLTILFRYPHIFIRMLFHIRNVLPLKSFRNPPP